MLFLIYHPPILWIQILSAVFIRKGRFVWNSRNDYSSSPRDKSWNKRTQKFAAS